MKGLKEIVKENKEADERHRKNIKIILANGVIIKPGHSDSAIRITYDKKTIALTSTILREMIVRSNVANGWLFYINDKILQYLKIL